MDVKEELKFLKNLSFCENSKKKKKKILGEEGGRGVGLGGGVRVDVNEELKFL